MAQTLFSYFGSLRIPINVFFSCYCILLPYPHHHWCASLVCRYNNSCRNFCRHLILVSKFWIWIKKILKSIDTISYSEDFALFQWLRHISKIYFFFKTNFVLLFGLLVKRFIAIYNYCVIVPSSIHYSMCAVKCTTVLHLLSSS